MSEQKKIEYVYNKIRNWRCFPPFCMLLKTIYGKDIGQLRIISKPYKDLEYATLQSDNDTEYIYIILIFYEDAVYLKCFFNNQSNELIHPKSNTIEPDSKCLLGHHNVKTTITFETKLKNVNPESDYVNIDWSSGFPIICKSTEKKMYLGMKQCIELFEKNFNYLFKKNSNCLLKKYDTPFVKQLLKFIETLKSEKCKEACSSADENDSDITLDDMLLKFNGVLPSEEVD